MSTTTVPTPKQGTGACELSYWMRPFALPAGALGWLAGQLMAVKNEPMNALAVELLELRPEDQVLEIGFGPGTTIPRMAERVANGCVAGIDPSALMVKQATACSRPFIQTGRVELREGSVSHMPYVDGRFTRVVAINSFQLWPNQAEDLREVRRVMRAGGLLLLCLRMQPRDGRRSLAPGFTEAEMEEVMGLLREAGFHHVRVDRRQDERNIVAVLAER